MTRKIRTLIVDDEALARRRLRQFAAEADDLEVIGECEDGREAVQFIRRDVPDLLFLDVQMPRLDGFRVISEVGAGRVPAVVFVTAFDQFALRAFEAHALDYLLKPFGRERFQQVVERARRQIRSARTAERLDALLGEVAAQRREGGRRARRLAVKARGRVIFLPVDEIDWVGAADNYVELHAGKTSYLVRETMAQIESKLDPDRFARIHRSAIVNVERVKEMQTLFSGDHQLTLRDGTRLTVSRTYKDRLLALLEKP